MEKRLYTTEEVAALFRVNKSTVKRWTDEGKLVCDRTPGGHRRFQHRNLSAFSMQYQYLSDDVRRTLFREDESYFVVRMLNDREPTTLRSVILTSARRGNGLEIQRLLRRICPEHRSFSETITQLLLPVIASAERLAAIEKIRVHDLSMVRRTVAHAAVSLAADLVPRQDKRGTLLLFTIHTNKVEELSILEALFNLHGYAVVNAGSPDTPAALHEWCRTYAPESIVCLVKEYHNGDAARQWTADMLQLEERTNIPCHFGTMPVLLDWPGAEPVLEDIRHLGTVLHGAGPQ